MKVERNYMSADTTHLEDLLSAVTDAMLSEERDLERIARQYDVPRDQVSQYIRLIRRLHVVLTGVQPSQRFVNRLRHDLIGDKQTPVRVVERVRHMPPRVQIAAGVVAVMGFMLLMRRRLIGDVSEITGAENIEAPAQ